MIHHPATTPLLLMAAPLLGWRVYRRVHRNITRQPVQPRRLMIRSAVVVLILAALLFWPSFEAPIALAMLAGISIGAPLAVYGLRLTRFETTAYGQFYTPNLYLGITISLLFLARLAWRLIMLWPLLASGDASLGHLYARNPLTYGLLALVLGYFAVYSCGVVRIARTLPSRAA